LIESRDLEKPCFYVQCVPVVAPNCSSLGFDTSMAASSMAALCDIFFPRFRFSLCSVITGYINHTYCVDLITGSLCVSDTIPCSPPLLYKYFIGQSSGLSNGAIDGAFYTVVMYFLSLKLAIPFLPSSRGRSNRPRERGNIHSLIHAMSCIAVWQGCNPMKFTTYTTINHPLVSLVWSY
jgi:hypothetical protein